MLDIDITFKRENFKLNICAKIDAPITGILGASGSGKSTLLSVIAGLLKPQQGHIRLNDTIFFDAKNYLLVPPHKRRIGLVFQDGQLFPHLSVRNNLLYGYKNILSDERHFELESVVHLLELESLLERKPSALSGGEKQRVALGRAVLFSPKLLLLDEPISALDDRLKKQILPFFLRVKTEFNIPMIYVTHSSSEIEFLTDTWLVIENGVLVNSEKEKLNGS